MYFEGWLISVGEHVIADVPQSGLAGAETGNYKEF